MYYINKCFIIKYICIMIINTLKVIVRNFNVFKWSYKKEMNKILSSANKKHLLINYLLNQLVDFFKKLFTITFNIGINCNYE